MYISFCTILFFSAHLTLLYVNYKHTSQIVTMPDWCAFHIKNVNISNILAVIFTAYDFLRVYMFPCSAHLQCACISSAPPPIINAYLLSSYTYILINFPIHLVTIMISVKANDSSYLTYHIYHVR